MVLVRVYIWCQVETVVLILFEHYWCFVTDPTLEFLCLLLR
jgi:hypothetical protein